MYAQQNIIFIWNKKKKNNKKVHSAGDRLSIEYYSSQHT